MCEHCVRDMTTFEHPSQAEHDGWLFPHGRAGYSGVTSEMIEAAEARCPYCPDPAAGSVLGYGLLPGPDLLAGYEYKPMRNLFARPPETEDSS